VTQTLAETAAATVKIVSGIDIAARGHEVRTFESDFRG
jgi:hypothetical protein